MEVRTQHSETPTALFTHIGCPQEISRDYRKARTAVRTTWICEILEECGSGKYFERVRPRFGLCCDGLSSMCHEPRVANGLMRWTDIDTTKHPQDYWED